MKRRYLLAAPLLLACGPFFYQAPPPLENYPRRIPGKNWLDVFHDASPAPADAESAPGMIQACSDLVKALPALPAETRRAKIDEMLRRNREGDFRLRAANFLHELRELAADDATLAAAGPYLEWRIGRLGLPAGFTRSAPARRWDWDDDDYQDALRDYRDKLEAATGWLDAAIADGPAVLLPNLKVQKAAMLFEYGSKAEARDLFQEVVESNPDHPRAGAARLMTGRCSLDLSRSKARVPNPKPGEEEEIIRLRRQAREELLACLEREPQGRFAADACGWLAAVASDQGDLGEGIRRQLQRLELQPTREVRRSVLRECDRFFTTLYAAEPDRAYHGSGLPFDEIAAHPDVCRLFVHHSLDPAAMAGMPSAYENFSSDRSALKYLEARLIRPLPLAKECLSRLGEAITRRSAGAAPDVFSLGVLAWSSYRNGEASTALALFDQALANGPGDSLLHGRALSLTALGRHQEAAACFDDLVREFPDGSLTQSVAFEHAIARFHAGEAGEALLMLIAIRDEDSGAPGGMLQPEFEVPQWIDTIAQFAPLRQLSAPLVRLPADDLRARMLRGIVRSRALAAEDFALAQRYLDPTLDPDVPVPLHLRWSLPRNLPLDRSRWQKELQSLAGATQLLGDEPNAAGHLKIGRRWKKLRGTVLMPSEWLNDYSQSEGEKLELLRRTNAIFLGFSRDEVEAELDSRDEMFHAFRHFMIAAETGTDPDVVAAALEEANEALFRLAEFSLYGATRAFERDHTALSAKLVARLQRDFPDRPESRRAVTWTFSAPALLEPWMPGDYSPGNSADLIAAGVLDAKARRSRRWSKSPGDELAAQIRQELREISKTPADGEGSGREALAGLRRRFDANRRLMNESGILGLVDDLDDLASVAAEPGISDEMFRRYARLRFARTVPAEIDEEWAPLAPWLAFIDRIRPVDRPGEWRVPNNDTVASWENYLADYPDGPKTEAATLRLLRLKVRAVCPIPQVEAFPFPDAPIPGGYKRLEGVPDLDPKVAAGLVDELDAFDARFPAGRYRADILLLRGALDAGTRDYPAALRNFADVLADPSHPELRMNAALRFSELCLRLLDRNERPAVAAAFRGKREALPFLKNLAHSDTCVSRLRPLLPWLEAE
ncbi:tetratricopeptide repeat protein [Luteolibacter marinus]|uniref:tetratricopeptide repeat protein n=1 Tax=Luteolibacter marinus TaxID=2776705 RepID=UPI001868FFE0|nr:tetratricopeptide repeat protein [Luteolibacter marinus]